MRLLLGDCVERMADLEPGSIDAVVCDPPYGFEGGFMAKVWDRFDGRENAALNYYVAGLIDGEGHFAIKQHTRGTFAPAFTMKLRADEEGGLRAIVRELGIGTVTSEHRPENDMVRWSVQSKSDCQRLVDLLDKYGLRLKKRLDYWTWREAVCEWTSRPRGNRWNGPADNTRMAHLRETIMATRKYTEVPWSGHEFQDWTRLWATEAIRILKPGGHLLAFGGTRTYHRLAAGIEDAGFEIRDTIAWLYGSGFPKSLDVSKEIDRRAGATREDVYANLEPDDDNAVYGRGLGVGVVERRPVTDDAKRWLGWGTALKPALEPIVVARKPLTGTVAGNVLEHGTGAINVDGCRVEVSATDRERIDNMGGYGSPDSPGVANEVFNALGQSTGAAHDLGRWPANVILDPAAAAALDEQSGVRRDGVAVNRNRDPETPSPHEASSYTIPARQAPDFGYGGAGGASRFFYCAKTSSAERNAGLDGFDEHAVRDGGQFLRASGRSFVDGVWVETGSEPQAKRNVHPTVKPIALMRWLIRLVTPPGGTVLDLFLGSGTTGIAAGLEGFNFVGIERDPGYMAIAEARIAWWAEHGEEALRRVAERDYAERQRQEIADAGQLDLFQGA